MPAQAFPPANARLRPDLWLLEDSVAHLNHGSYGAVPRPVLEAQFEAAAAVERSPERFYRSELFDRVAKVREVVADFLQVENAGLALVRNATEATQVVLDAVVREPGAEIVFTDHTYPWVKAAIERAQRERGAVPVLVRLPDPTGLTTAEFGAALVRTVAEALTERTALVVLDQVTSASALRLPVEKVCAELSDMAPIAIDGAHAPGLLPAPVPSGAAFWFGNLHKWAFAPRTAAALVVAPEWRPVVRPLVASYGESLGFPDSFSYLGTRGVSAFLALPASLAFPERHLGLTFEQLRQRNVALLDAGVGLLADGLRVVAPPSNGLPLRSLELGRSGESGEAWELGGRLRERGVEVAVSSLEGRLYLRVSVQAYVGLDDFELLLAALAAEGVTR